MSLTSFCRSRGVRRFSDERVEARRSIYVDLLTGGKDLSASLGAYLYDGLEQLLGLAARLHHVLALSLGVVVGVMRTLALVPLRRDGARERGVRRAALLERAIGRTREIGPPGGSISRGTHLRGVGFLDGVLPFLHDCFLRRRRRSFGVRSPLDRASAEARRGFDGPEVGTIAPSGRRTVSGAARRDTSGGALERFRAPSGTSWPRMLTSSRPTCPDTVRARARRVCRAARGRTLVVIPISTDKKNARSCANPRRRENHPQRENQPLPSSSPPSSPVSSPNAAA